MDVWNSGSNPTVPEYTYGDMIDIKANVHNTGDAAVNDNVLVYFYAGNPDAGGSYLGSATITGGISQGSSKTATLYGYTITSSAVDIYVKVDPLDSIDEKSELNNKAFKTLSIGPQNFDSDGDGLTDYDEINGMRTAFGIIKTNPYNNDTDGDHLLDGEEMGERYIDYYYMVSDPSREHSDNDGLNDFDELDIGTNPLNGDTDSDNILDSIDADALVRKAIEVQLTILEIRRNIGIGAVFGETGIEGGSFNWLVGDIASSPWYLVGWIGFSVIPGYGAIGDIRDALQALVNEDEVGAAMNAAGIVPAKGDLVKVNRVIGLHIIKYPSKISDIAKALVKYLKYVPYESVKLGALDAIYGGAATILKKGDINVDDLFRVVENNGDLGKTLGVAKSTTGKVTTMWLEKGKLVSASGSTSWVRDLGGSGWEHIRNNHVINPKGNEFLTFGPEYADELKIKSLIVEGGKNGKETIINGAIWRVYEVPNTNGKTLSALVGDNGYIVTARPGVP